MDSDLIDKLIADKYRVISLIGEHDAGDLFRAAHESRGFELILEVLPAAFSVDARWSRKFLDRARKASTLEHPNILAVKDFGEDSKGNVYAALENTDGVTLAELIKDSTKLDPLPALGIATQAAAAVAAAHERQVLHSRLDPTLIFVNGREEVKVLGFGSDSFDVARDADPRYLAPEQLSEYPVADARSDVYTLGAITYRLLTGEAPFEGFTRADVLAKQDAGGPPPLSTFRDDLHKEVEPILLAALARDPEARYQTMDAFLEDLNKLYKDSGGKKSAAAAAGHNVWRTFAIGLVAVVVLAGALIYATSSRHSDPTLSLKPDADALPVQPINPATGAQEEAYLKNGPLIDPNALQDPYVNNGQPGGGDGYNAWANGGMPPAGAPLSSGTTVGPLAGSQMPMPNNQLPPQAIAPPGQTVTVPNNGGSVFMPNEGGVILVPVPRSDEPAPTPTPKTGAANTAVKNPPSPQQTPKTAPTPAAKTDRPASQKDAKPAAAKPTVKKKGAED